jgi:tetratricopeptide (TPR) repeat protein
MKFPKLFLRIPAFIVLGILSLPAISSGADATPPATNSAAADQPSSQEVLRAYLQLQEQLHATQLQIEEEQLETKAAAAKSAAAIGTRLDMLEHAISAQRARELETMQSSNRVMVIVAGSFAGIGFVALVVMAYFQWRAVTGLAHLATALPAPRALGPGSGLPVLDTGEDSAEPTAAAEQSNLRLLGALEQLEKRLYQLEHTATAAARQLAHGDRALPAAPHSNGNGPDPGQLEDGAATQSELSALLRQGQVLLERDEPQAALRSFDQALALEPANAEALVKKGTALERLQKTTEALECYDRAITADSSLTIAYLQKGGLCNRLERYKEALDCYEQALRTQEKRG